MSPVSQARSLQRSFRYWPASHKGAFTALPSGRNSAFVHLKRNDVDGLRMEPVLSFVTRDGQRLASLDREEFAELRKISARLLSLGELWEKKIATPPPPAMADLEN